MLKLSVGLAIGLLLVIAEIVQAADCKRVRFSDVGWTDITVTTSIASEILKTVGYETKITHLSVPVTFASLKNKNIDVFLGNWMPSMAADIKPYQQDGSVETVGTILKGARYTLAVPKYVYEAGVKSFSDLAQYKDRFHGKIFGIEPGNDGNRHIQEMIQQNAYQLSSWKLVESNEQAMLMEVFQSVKSRKWVVFLGWEPHPMNKKIQMNYLSGGEAYFGKDQGNSSVYINTRKNYFKECPGLESFFKKINLSIADTNSLMTVILDQKVEPNIAARKWIRTNFSKVENWLLGLRTPSGELVNSTEVKEKITESLE